MGKEGVLAMVAGLEVEEPKDFGSQGGDQGLLGLEVEVEMLGYQKEG